MNIYSVSDSVWDNFHVLPFFTTHFGVGVESAPMPAKQFRKQPTHPTHSTPRTPILYCQAMPRTMGPAQFPTLWCRLWIDWNLWKYPCLHHLQKQTARTRQQPRPVTSKESRDDGCRNPVEATKARVHCQPSKRKQAMSPT